MKVILACAALLVSAAVSAAPPAIEPIEANAQVGSGVHMTATLATFGSFEWKRAPSVTRLAIARRTVLTDLRNGRIGVDRAEVLQKRADNVRSLLDRAKAACRQDDRTAKCRGDEAATERLLAQANAELAVIFK